MFEQTVRQNLYAIARRYADLSDMTIRQVSKRCYGRGSFLEAFRRGQQSISVAKLDEVLRWFQENWPQGAGRLYLQPASMSVQPAAGRKSPGKIVHAAVPSESKRGNPAQCAPNQTKRSTSSRSR
jgi:hypothetical protein